jgi:hypothetical protein
MMHAIWAQSLDGEQCLALCHCQACGSTTTLSAGIRENLIIVMNFESLWLTRMARKNKATHDDSEKGRAKLLLGPE